MKVQWSFEKQNKVINWKKICYDWEDSLIQKWTMILFWRESNEGLFHILSCLLLIFWGVDPQALELAWALLLAKALGPKISWEN